MTLADCKYLERVIFMSHTSVYEPFVLKNKVLTLEKDKKFIWTWSDFGFGNNWIRLVFRFYQFISHIFTVQKRNFR